MCGTIWWEIEQIEPVVGLRTSLLHRCQDLIKKKTKKKNTTDLRERRQVEGALVGGGAVVGDLPRKLHAAPRLADPAWYKARWSRVHYQVALVTDLMNIQPQLACCPTRQTNEPRTRDRLEERGLAGLGPAQDKVQLVGLQDGRHAVERRHGALSPPALEQAFDRVRDGLVHGGECRGLDADADLGNCNEMKLSTLGSERRPVQTIHTL